MGLFGNKKPQKGWMPAGEAEAKAEKAARKVAIRKARKGKGAAPGYKETKGGLW